MPQWKSKTLIINGNPALILISKQLRPINYPSAVDIAPYPNIRKLTIQDIGPMGLAVHPSIHDRFGGWLPIGDVFA